MSKILVQCKGSGRRVPTSLAKRATCPTCGRMQDVTGVSTIRKHMKLTTRAKLRKSRKR